MSSQRIVYRTGHDGAVQREIAERPTRGSTVALNFHENIISTYHQLETTGQLPQMSAREKSRIRDIHTQAQSKEYWPAHYTKEERGV